MRKKEPMFVGAGPEMLSARAPAEDWSSGCIGGGGGDKGGTGGRAAEPRGGTGGQRGDGGGRRRDAGTGRVKTARLATPDSPTGETTDNILFRQSISLLS